MRLSVGAATDVGQVREGNEDAYLIDDPLFAVADGMGGALGGEVASSLAIATIRELFSRREGDLVRQVEEANRAVFERSQSDRTVAGMGTTLTAALVDDGRVHLAHVGDSRAYLFRDGELSQLTEDHTLVHRMVVAGEITPSEAEVHPHRSILTRVLGMDGVVEVDEGWLDVRAGDRILLCTDGLTGMLGGHEIGDILEASRGDPQATADRLVSSANRAGGVDNITAILLDFDEGSDRDPDPEPAATIGTGTTVATTPEPAAIRPSERRTTPTIESAPRRPGSPARLLRIRVLLGAGIAVAVIALGLVGLRLYLDRQWYVGVEEGHVALFRGVPETVAGFDLHHVITETEIPAAEAEALALYRDLPEGITAGDRESAEAIVAQIRADVARAERRAAT